MSEQRNRYRGSTERPFLTLDFGVADGSRLPLTLLADTGCPFGLIVGTATFHRLICGPAASMSSNFGINMPGGWFRLFMPETGLVELVRAYASDIVERAVQADDPSFVGLVGLPIVRLGEYGGNVDEFWFRYPPA